MKALMTGARMVAIMIAALAFIDPSVTSNRRTKPVVAVVAAGGPATRELVGAVEKQLARSYTVIRAPYPSAAATVIIGTTLPANVSELRSPVFAVAPTPVGPTVTIEDLRAPATSSLEARVPVVAVARVTGARGRTVDVGLSTGGWVVDRVARTVSSDDERVTIPLSFVPATAGPAVLRVVAQVGGTRDSVVADAVVDVHEKRWAVLFFDRRPSWMSTFVRRSLEKDRRFVVASRVVTSTRVSTDVGRPPSSLEDPTLTDLYDAIIVGAPEALTTRDVAGLDAFLRRRGGGVVLLFDEQPKSAGAYEQLTNVGRWTGTTSSAPDNVEPTAPDSGGLRATELMWPVTLPAVSDMVARTQGATGLAANRPIVWQTPVGAGQLVVSGALDAWRFRDPATSGFDGFWRRVVAGAADGAMPAVGVAVDRLGVVEPGDLIEINVAIRDAMLADAGRPIGASVSASLGDGAGRSEIRLWPTGVGRFSGVVRAPANVGEYRVRVVADGARADVPVVVAHDVGRVQPDDGKILATWVGTRGGSVVPANQLEKLSGELGAAVTARSRLEQWYPMRSAWWIVPFVLLLAAEWWWRRKQGLA